MRTALAALFCLAVGLASARPSLAQPTMGELWPNQDGTSWSYDQHYESFDDNGLVVDNQIRIFFDGMTEAPTAIPAQYLRQALLSGPAGKSLNADLPADPFLRQLWIARPDLRSKIRQRLDDAACPMNVPEGRYTVLLNGEFAFLETASEIASWRCNLADTRSWLWLVSNLTIGNTFTLQLIPDLTSNVFLHGTIAAIEPATVPAGTFTDCVRVDYVVDYGTSECTDQGGSPSGTFRSETRGSIHFAPLVGPVACSEEFVNYVEATGTCVPPEDIGRVFARASLRLISGTTASPPMSWGRLKTVYR